MSISLKIVNIDTLSLGYIKLNDNITVQFCIKLKVLVFGICKHYFTIYMFINKNLINKKCKKKEELTCPSGFCANIFNSLRIVFSALVVYSDSLAEDGAFAPGGFIFIFVVCHITFPFYVN